MENNTYGVRLMRLYDGVTYVISMDDGKKNCVLPQKLIEDFRRATCYMEHVKKQLTDYYKNIS